MSENMELDQLQVELSGLMRKTIEIRRQHDAQYEAEVAPFNERIRTLLKRKQQLNPPACFGKRDDLDLPACDTCDAGVGCYRAMKARQEAS